MIKHITEEEFNNNEDIQRDFESLVVILARKEKTQLYRTFTKLK